MTFTPVTFESDMPTVLAEARMRVMTAASFAPSEVKDPNAGLREEISRIARHAPGADVAMSLLTGQGAIPVAVDRDSQEPSSEPLTSLEAIATHFRQNVADGVGLLMGARPGGPTLVGVMATPAAWRDWYAEHGVDVRKHRNDDGDVTAEDKVGRDLGTLSLVRWAPPQRPPAEAGVAFGAAAIRELTDRMRTGRAREQAERPVLLVWSSAVVWSASPGEDGQTLRFKNRRLGPGVQLIADGVVPWWMVREDGWSLDSTRPLAQAAMPAWLAEAFGGRWGAVVTAGGAQ